MKRESRSAVFEDDAFVVALGSWDAFAKEHEELFALRRAAFSATGVSPEELVDEYDPNWQHVVSFEKASRSVVGSYRLRFPHEGNQDAHSVATKLFALDAAAQPLLRNGIELGRAALAPCYQRSFRGLLTLWRGLVSIADASPSVRSLYGPVTVDHRTPLTAIERLERFLLQQHSAQWTEAVTPIYKRNAVECSGSRNGDRDGTFRELESSVLASGIDWRVPALLRQYAAFGARFSRFGRWPSFGNAYVCFAAIDLASARREMLRSRR